METVEAMYNDIRALQKRTHNHRRGPVELAGPASRPHDRDVCAQTPLRVVRGFRPVAHNRYEEAHSMTPGKLLLLRLVLGCQDKSDLVQSHLAFSHREAEPFRQFAHALHCAVESSLGVLLACSQLPDGYERRDLPTAWGLP